jgi:hypothetical protein
VRVSLLAASALCVALSTGSGQAQVPATPAAQFAPLPSVGFVPPYEIARNVRRAGFDPLAPPLREGSTYVVRATDFRGILMRVVVDARSGAIRDVSPIVPGPGSYGQQAGMMPYGMAPDDMPPPYGQPADYNPPPVPLDDGDIPGRSAHPLTRASVTVGPPLPRPRPPELASRKPVDDSKANGAKPAAVTDSKPAADTKSAGRAVTKSETTGSIPAAASPAASAQGTSPATAAAKPGKSLEPPPIND